jgi:hypothetical protein
MSDGGIALTNPRLLLEAARVFNAPGSGYRNAAASVAEQALAALKVEHKTAPDEIEPEVEQAIIGDCAALRLAGRVDGGYCEALALLDEQIGRKRPDGLVDEMRNDINGRLHLLRAFAHGQQYNDLRDKEGKPLGDPKCIELRQAIRDDLKFALALNPDLQNINRPAWDPGPGQQAEADLDKAYHDGPEIKEAVSAAQPAAAQPAPEQAVPEQTASLRRAPEPPAAEQPAAEQPATASPAPEQPATASPETLPASVRDMIRILAGLIEREAAADHGTARPAAEQSAAEQSAAEQSAAEQPATAAAETLPASVRDVIRTLAGLIEREAAADRGTARPAAEQPATAQRAAEQPPTAAGVAAEC